MIPFGKNGMKEPDPRVMRFRGSAARFPRSAGLDAGDTWSSPSKDNNSVADAIICGAGLDIISGV